MIVSNTRIDMWHYTSVAVLKSDKKGSTEIMGVAALYEAAYNHLFYKNKICKNKRKSSF